MEVRIRQCCGSGSETLSYSRMWIWIRIRKKSFWIRIRTAPDPQWIWSKTTLKTLRILEKISKNACWIRNQLKRRIRIRKISFRIHNTACQIGYWSHWNKGFFLALRRLLELLSVYYFCLLIYFYFSINMKYHNHTMPAHSPLPTWNELVATVRKNSQKISRAFPQNSGLQTTSNQ